MSKLAIRKEIAALLIQAIPEGILSGPVRDVESTLDVPNDEKFGDLSTAIILKIAKETKQAPQPLAEKIVKKLNDFLPSGPLGSRLERVSVEGPGFINFYFSKKELWDVLSDIQSHGAEFGKPSLPAKKILLEFVSANPTGPLTVAHGRQAALGDSLARILRFCGHQVSTEYYNNDEGVQIETLGKSLAFRVEELTHRTKMEMPENFYRGDYLIELAKQFIKKNSAQVYSDFAKDEILKGIQKDLKDFDVHFENYYSQKELARSGMVEKTLDELKKMKVVYESEGALWLRSTERGDDKDRVLIKSDKTYTYLTPDIAYHHEKFSRGFDKLINIWGPDHHGYIARLKASQAALGHDAERIHILIAQLVTLYEGKKQVRMSTRAGEFVTLREILDEVGKDAGRFFFVMRKFDAHLDFDLALAKTQTPENPVFYIQYAHARIASIKNTARDGRPDVALLPALNHPTEIRLLRLLCQFEDAVTGAEKTLEPFRLVPYLMELAASFHRFYTENRVVTEDAGLTQARLALINGVQTVIRSGLNLLGVSAPDKM